MGKKPYGSRLNGIKQEFGFSMQIMLKPLPPKSQSRRCLFSIF